MLSPRAKAYSAFALCVVIAILLVAIITLARQAHGHEAPSGFQYPAECCANQHCRPIQCGTIHEDRNGGASWTGLHFNKEQTKISGDGNCHVCIGYSMHSTTGRVPYCIFLAPTM